MNPHTPAAAPSPADAPGWLRALSAVTLGLRWISGLIIAATMLITGIDVIMRYALARPLEFSIPVSMLALIAMVVLALPDVTLRAEHISMDLFYRRFSARGRLFADALTTAATALFTLITGLWAGNAAIVFAGLDLQTSGTFSLPIWAGYALLSLGMLLVSLTVVLRFITERAGIAPAPSAGEELMMAEALAASTVPEAPGTRAWNPAAASGTGERTGRDGGDTDA